MSKRKRNSRLNQRNQRRLGGRKPVNNVRVVRRTAPVAQTQVITNNGVLRELRIKHREFVEDVSIPDGAGVFKKYEVNPGLESFFPWLSAIAQRFESYYFHSLKVHFVTSVPTSTEGNFALCPDYDAADDNSAASKSELLSFEDSVRGSWWTNFTMKSTGRNLRKSKTHYVRGQDLASNLDIKMYDVMQLNTMASGTAAKVGGELWVEYDIQLITPQRKHEGEALQQKRTECDCTAYNAAEVKTFVINALNNLMDVVSFGSGDYPQLGIRTPGVYQVSMASLDVGPKAALDNTISGGLVANDLYRDTSIGMISHVWNTGLTEYSFDGILEVFEEADAEDSYALLNFDNITVDPDGGTHAFWLTVSELLPNSGRRSAWMKSKERLEYVKAAKVRRERRELRKHNDEGVYVFMDDKMVKVKTTDVGIIRKLTSKSSRVKEASDFDLTTLPAEVKKFCDCENCRP